MGAVAGQERASAPAPSHDGAGHLGHRDGQQGQGDHAGRTGDADAPGVGEEHGHGRPEQVGATVAQIDAGRRTVVPEERDQGPGQRCGEQTTGAGSGRTRSRRRPHPDAGGQHVEAVEQVEAVDEDDGGHHDERHADPTRQVDGNGEGDQHRRPAGPPAAAAREDRTGRRRPPGRAPPPAGPGRWADRREAADHDAAEDGDATQVGHGGSWVSGARDGP